MTAFPALRLLRIMMIDDNSIEHFVVNKLLENENFQYPLQSFSMAETALEFLIKNQGNYEILPDVILLDINMPQMSGFDFMEEFNSLDLSIKQRCKVIMLSSSFYSDDIKRADENPFILMYVSKPFDKEKLGQIYERCIEQ